MNKWHSVLHDLMLGQGEVEVLLQLVQTIVVYDKSKPANAHTIFLEPSLRHASVM